ncbi:MAG: hypothetical protein ACI9BD_001188 [Candidatus Marinamargulisbacteria bacterium]|jgi:hypothetical protein
MLRKQIAFFARHPSLGSGASAMLATASNAAFFYPFDVAKHRTQNSGLTFKSELQFMFRKAGLRGTYTNFSIALANLLPSRFLNFALYDLYRNSVFSNENMPKGTPPWMRNFAAAAAAAASKNAIMCPTDRVQILAQTSCHDHLGKLKLLPPPSNQLGKFIKVRDFGGSMMAMR